MEMNKNFVKLKIVYYNNFNRDDIFHQIKIFKFFCSYSQLKKNIDRKKNQKIYSCVFNMVTVFFMVTLFFSKKIFKNIKFNFSLHGIKIIYANIYHYIYKCICVINYDYKN